MSLAIFNHTNGANFKTLRFHPSKEGPGVIFVIKRMVNVKKSIDEL